MDTFHTFIVTNYNHIITIFIYNLTKIMKRNYFICCLFALLSSLNVLAFDFEADGIYYTITGSGTVSVVKGTYDYDGDVTIPKTVSNGVETFNVTGIGEGAFKSCGELVSAILPEGLTSIGKEAFYQSGIKTINFPSTLTSMGSGTFYECGNLTSVVLPDALKDIAEYAFYQCTNLKTLTLGSQTITIEQYAFYRTSLETVFIPQSTKKVGRNAFAYCEKMKSLKVDNAAATIGYGAFSYCIALEDIDLGNAIYDIGALEGNNIIYSGDYVGVFQHCDNLKSITLPASLKNIGLKAFAWCSRLYDVQLPNSLTAIGQYAFYDCAIASIYLPESLTNIYDCAFMGCPLTNVSFSSTSHLTNIGSYAFNGCPLSSITFPSSLKKIGRNSFENTPIQEIIIPTSVTDIDVCAFSNCKLLKDVKIDNATVKMTAAFFGCTSLENVDLGNSTTELNSDPNNYHWGCFGNCVSLKEIRFPNSINIISHCTFQGCSNLENIILPNMLVSIGAYMFSDCTKLKNITLPNTLQNIEDYVFSGCTQLSSITLPSSLITIGINAFQNCNSLKSVLIPENVNSIGSNAFLNCTGLESVIFDNSVLAIQTSTFQGCKSLKKVDLGKITYIGQSAFRYCTQLEKIIIPNSVEKMIGSFANCTGLKEVSIGTGLKSLESYGNEWDSAAQSYYPLGVFYGCLKLNSVVINSEILTALDNGCFYNCKSLKKIELPASVTSIGGNAFNGCNVLSHIYMNATTPPSISGNTFSDYNTPTLHVPSSAKTSYTKADNWKNFKNIIAIGSEPKATAEEIAALDALLTEATALYNGSVEGAEPGNYRPGAKAALKAVIDEVAARIKDNMLAEDVEDCTELLNTAMKSFKNKQVKNDIQTNNTLAFAETLKAATGSEFRLPIEMNNTDEITGVQFDLYLPEGMALSQDEYGDYNIELSERTTARRHSVASRVMPDGALRVVVSSQQNATFSGNSGTLLTLVLFPASTLEAGDYDVELKNVILTDPDAKRYAAADMKSVITVSTYTMGDVNNDGHIDVADLAGVVRFILENADASLIFNAADMDGNGVVEINDYAALVNVILNQSTPSAAPQHRAKAIRNTVIGLSDLCMNTNGEGELMVHLDNNDMQYTGLQFDLRLPDGIELMDEGAEATGIHHGAWVQKRADGTYRVICASLMNDELREGNVLRLQVKVTGAVNRELEVIADNVVLSDVNAVRHEAASAKAALNTDDATSISEELRVNEESANVIFNLSGQRLNKLQKGVNIVNGKKTVVK